MKEKKIDRLYFIIFLILEFIIIFIFRYFDMNKSSTFIITQVIFVILYTAIYTVIILFMDKIVSRMFCIEYNKIMREYQKKDDAKVFYDKLKNVKIKPNTPELKNTYNLSMSTAAFKNGENDEALEYLNKIETDDEHILKVIEDERKTIMDEKAKMERQNDNKNDIQDNT